VPQVLRVALVDVRGLAVGDQQTSLRCAAAATGAAGVAQRCTMRVDRPPFMPASGLGRVVVRLTEVLEAEVLHVVPPVGGEAVDRKGVADRVDGPGQQTRRLTGELENGGLVSSSLCTRSLVDSDRSSRITPPGRARAADADVDARVGHDAAPDVDEGAHRGVESISSPSS